MTTNDYIQYFKSIPIFDWIFLICCIGFIIGMSVYNYLVIRKRKKQALKMLETIAKKYNNVRK